MSITIIPNISSSATDCHGIIEYRIQDTVSVIIIIYPLRNLLIASESPIEKYEMDASIKNHIDTKLCGYVPS